mmetsp:Transcript_22927/g.28130  ORF Transcript_22927/g.28130 Transcript_22927/m.28130 type:complete len:378 (+) Transcript_22927:228-1361(+)|eukprot:CAMPEP_0204875200 /NCGR_PEP_ID=MMETSP1348-20121228/45307_1 /ASSEMBLY_ACC=CAM_ASM_000700 /TAXON_ID=215587 /ORGANISM="Aplanochytrium stocchinoi, Strain GSBS06" /LENGTH=377 /DNA_ID=CAMNT_0052031499 /DNA_START=90 /DNA_END=1223 /DNA_ORIENTATION=-
MSNWGYDLTAGPPPPRPSRSSKPDLGAETPISLDIFNSDDTNTNNAGVAAENEQLYGYDYDYSNSADVEDQNEQQYGYDYNKAYKDNYSYNENNSYNDYNYDENNSSDLMEHFGKDEQTTAKTVYEMDDEELKQELEYYFTNIYVCDDVQENVEETFDYYQMNGLNKMLIIIKIRFGPPMRGTGTGHEVEEESDIPILGDENSRKKSATRFGTQIVPTDVSKEISFLRKKSRNAENGSFLRKTPENGARKPSWARQKRPSGVASPTLDRKLSKIREKEKSLWNPPGKKKSEIERKFEKRRASQNQAVMNQKKNPALRNPSEPRLGNTLQRKFDRIRDKEESRNAPVGPSGPCSSYQLDMAGASFGVCTCGYQKVDHR